MTTRKAGDKVGNIMAEWREARSKYPELFEDKQVKVWQSPTSYVDNIIYSWQTVEEQSRFTQTLKLVDSLSTHWSEQSQEQNWLTQVAQASVPAGCTPLAQLTDVTLAQPCKAKS